MAKRRMFSNDIIDTDMFLEMPATAQLLYFHLAMRADDDGFVSAPKRILRLTGSSEGDLRVLFERDFVIPFSSGICVIKHWKIHNYIQSDRYHETIYKDEKLMLQQDTNGVYKMDTECLQDGYRMDTEVRLGEVSQGKASQGKIDAQKPRIEHTESQEAFNNFWKSYPKKKSKGTAEKVWAKINPSLHDTIMASLEKHKQSADWLKEGGQFIPYPASWLNAKGWEDEIEETKPKNDPYKGLKLI